MSVKPAQDAFSLAARQHAADRPFRFRGKQVGTLAQVGEAVSRKEAVAGLSGAENQALLAKLEAFYFIGFNFAGLDAEADLASVALPRLAELSSFRLSDGVIPSTAIQMEISIKRNADSLTSGEKAPFVQLDFYYLLPDGKRALLGWMKPLYIEETRTLSLYTCAAIKIEEGRSISKELIATGFLTAAKVMRALGKDVTNFFTYHVLWGDDYQDRDGQIVRPEVQARIDRMQHILESMGFFPGGSIASKESHMHRGQRTISEVDLAERLRQNWWTWAYQERFNGSFAGRLDQGEIELRIQAAREEEQRVIDQKVQTWLEGAEAKAILGSQDASLDDLIAVLKNLEVNFDLSAQAVPRILETVEKNGFQVDEVKKAAEAIRGERFVFMYYGRDYEEKEKIEIKRFFFHSLPKQYQTADLKGKLGIS